MSPPISVLPPLWFCNHVAKFKININLKGYKDKLASSIIVSTTTTTKPTQNIKTPRIYHVKEASQIDFKKCPDSYSNFTGYISMFVDDPRISLVFHRFGSPKYHSPESIQLFDFFWVWTGLISYSSLPTFSIMVCNSHLTDRACSSHKHFFHLIFSNGPQEILIFTSFYLSWI